MKVDRIEDSTLTGKTLLLETSGRVGLAALAEGATLGPVRRLDQAQKHARDLAPAVAELLAAAGWRPRDLTAVIVSRGPGSYTGLRVGLMSAKTLAYATGAALIGIETFAVIAAQAPAEVDRLAVLADAQQDRVYVQTFLRESGWRASAPLAIVRFADWLEARGPEEWVSGPGLARWESQLPPDARRLAIESREPGPEALLRLGVARLLAGERDDPFALEPIYLRASSAEEQWKARQAK